MENINKQPDIEKTGVQISMPVNIASNHFMFRERVKDIIDPSQPAKETVENMVKAALEVEFGSSFSFNPRFPKMVSKIADSILTNQELRRQALAVASTYMSEKEIKIDH